MSERADTAQRTRQIEVASGDRMLTKGQIEIFALGIFSNSGPYDRPGRMRGDVWTFYSWNELSESQREPFMRKAISVYATLCAYGMRIVNLDA